MCICVYHIFIHSSLNGHLVCFHILAIVNSGVHVSFELWFSLDICPCVGFHGSSDGKKSAFNTENLSSIHGTGRSPRERSGHHSSILAWRIPTTWTLGSASHVLPKNRYWGFYGDCIKLSVKCEVSCHLTMLSSPYHEHGISFHLFKSSLFYVNHIL